MADPVYLVTKVKVETMDTECLYRGNDRDIAQATFQAACMDLNSLVPTPILFERQLQKDGVFSLKLLNATVLFPGVLGGDWQQNPDMETAYKELFTALAESRKVVEGYTSFGQVLLNDNAQPITEEEPT